MMKKYNYFYFKTAITREEFERDVPENWEDEVENDVYSYGGYKAVMHDLTYDIHFKDEHSRDSKGFETSQDDCLDYIKEHNGTDHSYFEDYKGGTVSIVCNETGETVYEEEIV